MNDYLLESQGRKKEPSITIPFNEYNQDPNQSPPPESPRTDVKNSTAYKILTIERQAKINVTFNNICIILFLTLFPFGVIVSTFVNVNWFLMVDAVDYNYWVNLLFIQKSCKHIPPAVNSRDLCLESSTVYFFPMLTFSLNGCSDGDLTKDDPANLCSVMISYVYSGMFAGGAIALGMILHMIHIWQLMRITFSRDPTLIKGFHPLRVAYFIIFLYLASILYWLFGSASIINTNAQKNILQRFGISFYSYLGALAFFVLLVLWFRKVYKKGIRRNLVNTLLDAEKKYINEFESTEHYDNNLP